MDNKTCRQIIVETVAGTCNDRFQGENVLVTEGVDYDSRRCPRCGSLADPLVRNDADCRCWRWSLYCPECGHVWFD